eukprot:12994_4
MLRDGANLSSRTHTRVPGLVHELKASFSSSLRPHTWENRTQRSRNSSFQCVAGSLQCLRKRSRNEKKDGKNFSKVPAKIAS